MPVDAHGGSPEDLANAIVLPDGLWSVMGLRVRTIRSLLSTDAAHRAV